MEHEPNVVEGFVDNLFSLEGKIAVVTGGASGLGEAIAHGLGQAGAVDARPQQTLFDIGMDEYHP